MQSIEYQADLAIRHMSKENKKYRGWKACLCTRMVGHERPQGRGKTGICPCLEIGKKFHSKPEVSSFTHWVPTRAKILAYEDMIGHNDWRDWAGESVKVSLDPGDSNAFLEVGCAHLWRHCDAVSGEKLFSRRLGKPVASIQTAIDLKPNTLERNILHKKCR